MAEVKTGVDQATHEKAIADAKAAGVAEGAKAERTRISSVKALAEAAREAGLQF
jgi:ribosomal protein L18